MASERTYVSIWQVQESVSTKVLLVHSLRRKKGMYFVTPDDTPIHVEPQPFAKKQTEQESVKEERGRRAEAERLAKEAAQKRDEEEEVLRKKEEEARKKAEQAAAARHKREEEAAARKNREAEEEAAQKKAQEEEEARKKEEAEAARRRVEEERARTWAEEQRERKAAEDRQAAKAARKKAEEEAQREEERKRVAAEAEAQKRAEEETRRKKEEEEEAARKKYEGEAAAHQKHVEEEEEETRMKEQDEAAAQRKKEEEEAARKKSDKEVDARKNKEEEEARKKGQADAAQKKEEPAGNGTRKAPKNAIVPKLSSPQGLARWSEHQHVAPSPYARGREQEGAARDRRRGGGTRVFAVGQRVLAKFENSDEFFDGVIDSINRNGTFVVAFDDGDIDRSVPRQNIAHPAAAVVSRDGEESADVKPIEHMSGSVGGALVFSGGEGGGLLSRFLESDSESEQLVLGSSAALALLSATSSCGDDIRRTMSTNDASWATSHASTTSAEQVVVAKRALSFALGQRVLARFEGSEEFFDGFIAALNDDGTFGSLHPFTPIGLGRHC